MLLCCADPSVPAEYEVPSATAVLPNTRRVYRLLKTRDIRPSLKDTEVHVLWPDNGIWYLAEVLEVRDPTPLPPATWAVQHLQAIACCCRSHQSQSPATEHHLQR
jgi:hypothetical protein